MKVSVFGLGYVGSVTAACLASSGHSVVGMDVNPDKVRAINNGESPIIEPGLAGLISEGVRTGHLSAVQDTDAAVAQSDASFICVGTPSDANGNLNFVSLDHVFSEIGHALSKAAGYKVITLRSTVLPGTLADRLIPQLVRESGREEGRDFGTAINPEFLREGSAIHDFRNPPFTLIGQTDQRAGDVLAELYAGLSAPVFRTDPDTACMVKYASNAFHGLKVTFANEIGQLCGRLGVDGAEVMDIFCQDTRLNISPRYLRPGFAFGGSCLPKDLRALLYMARHTDLRLPVLESILPSNRLHIQGVADLILRQQRKGVGFIGLSFKPGTDDLRESPIVDLVEMLSGKGLKVRIYDDNVSLSRLIGGNKAFIEKTLPHISALLCTSMEEVVQGSEVVIVAHNPSDGGQQLLNLLKPEQLVIDFVKIASNGNHHPTEYEGVCW